MSVVSVPSDLPSSRRLPLPVIVLGLVALLAGAAYYFRDTFFHTSQSSALVGTFQPALIADLDVRLNKDGELQAVNNIEVVNKVEGINTIVELIKEGEFVHKGKTLVVLDSSNIREKWDLSVLDLQNAEAALSQSQEAKDIQEATNKANLQAAELDFEVAKIELQEYTEGLAKQARSEAETKVRMAEIMVKNKEEDLATTRNLFAKGFVTAADVKKAELELLTCQNDMNKAETDLQVLKDFTHMKNMATKKSAVAQAEQKFERTKKENSASMNKCIAALRQAQQALALRKELTSKLKEQLDNCTIIAPADGMVVYASSSDRSGAEPIKEGGNVRNLQVLLRLPDTGSMKAVVRVQEGQVSKLRVDDNNPMRATVTVVGYKKPIGASISKISVLADSSQRWWNPDLKEYPVELVLDETPANCKPGLGCQVEVLMDRRPKVLTIPLTSIYSQGNQSFVFVRDGVSVRPAEVKIGATNDTHAEIKEGIEAGTDVLLLQPGQGRALLEKAGIKVQPTTRPGDNMKPGRGKRNAGAGGNAPRAESSGAAAIKAKL